MARKAIWKSEWLLGVAVAVAVLVISRTDFVQSVEQKAHDLGVRAANRIPGDHRIAVIAIDDNSIANIGPWPRPREVHAKLIDGLKGAHANVIGYTVLFSELQLDPGLPYVGKLRAQFGLLSPTEQRQMEEFGGVLSEAESALNTDRKLADSVGAAGNVVLPVLFRLGKPDKDLPEYIRKNAVQTPTSEGMAPVPASSLDVAVLDEIGQRAASIGHLNSPQDVDRAIRTGPLLLAYFDQLHSSLALLAKQTQERLATGDQMAKAIRECAEIFGIVDVAL